MKKLLLVCLAGFIAIHGFTQGNVGIGTTTPSERLHVTQTADVNKNVIYGYASQNAIAVDYQNTGIAGFGQGNANGFGLGFGVKGVANTNGYGGVGVYAGLSTAIPMLNLNNTFYALYTDVLAPAANRYAGVFMNGNVGIGTATPGYILDVAGRIRLRSSGSVSAGVWLNKNDNLTTAGFMGTYDNDNYIGMYGDNGAGWSFLMNTANGNVGIGNNAPADKLDVNGNINITGSLKVNGNSGTAGQVLVSNGAAAPVWQNPAGSNSWTTNGADIYNSNSGNVGIGTATPAQKLDINGRMNITNGVIQRGGAAITATSDLGLYSRVAGNYIRFVTNAAPIVFFSDDNIGTNANMIIQADGKVGIGNSSPQAQLDISGFTKLGSDAPKIKMKRITGTTSPEDGMLVTFSHGLNPDKILAVDVLVFTSAGSFYLPPGFTYFPGYEYNFSLYGSDISILNIYLNSANILSKPVRILITYEE